MIRKLRLQPLFVILLGLGAIGHSEACLGGQLYVGGATISITPDQPVLLDGQRRTRVSKKVETPCIATALAVETRDGEKSLEQAIFVACDLVAIRGGEVFHDEVREQIKDRIPKEVFPKLIISATHTHTGPVTQDGKYQLPESGVMPPLEYRAYLVKQLADVVVEAWENRAPARVAWGLGQAVVAHNRRAVYADNTSVMYGKTNSANFRGLEGTEDHGVEILYFWNMDDELIATSINLACPSQEAESGSVVNADFWHQVREKLREKHEGLLVLPWTGASGDQSPHLMYRKKAEERMRKLRGVDSLNEIARRIVATWEDVYQVVQDEKQEDVVLTHHVETLQLPYRKITEAEAASAKAAIARMEGTADSGWGNRWHGSVVERYEKQQNETLLYDMTLHAVRLGDIAIVTNSFELFTDFGVQMKSRSPALQTFVIQLSGSGTYLPTERAVAGGGYSAVAESSHVGPDGGQVLVDKTVEALDKLWDSETKTVSSPR